MLSGKLSLFSLHFCGLCHEANIRSRWQHERGNTHDVKPILQLALAIYERTEGDEPSPLYGDLHHSLGAIANETNNGQSCLLHNKRLVEVRQKDFKKSGILDYRFDIAFSQLGTGWMMTNKDKKAVKCYKKSIKTLKTTSGFSKAMLSIPLTNLGFALWVQGHLDEASAVLEGALSDRQDLFGIMDTESMKYVFNILPTRSD